MVDVKTIEVRVSLVLAAWRKNESIFKPSLERNKEPNCRARGKGRAAEG